MKTKLQTLLDASQVIFGDLQKSPFWGLLQDDPHIIDWIAALGEMEAESRKGVTGEPKA